MSEIVLRLRYWRSDNFWEIAIVAKSPILLSSKLRLLRFVKWVAMAIPPFSLMEFPERSIKTILVIFSQILTALS
jgi:hypothetical protein